MPRISQLMLEVGRAQAAGEAGAGQAWGQGVARLGDILSNGLQQYQGLKDAEQTTKLRALQTEEAQLGVNAAKQTAADRTAMDTAVGVGQSATLDPNAIEAALPGHLRMAFRKSWNDAEAAKLNLGKAKTEAANAEADYLGALAAGVKPFLGGEDHGIGAAQIALQHAKEAGYDVGPLLEQIQQNPQALPQLVNGLIAKSPTYSKLAGEESDRALRRTQEERALQAAKDAAADRAADNTRADATATETKRHNQALEAAAQTRANAASADVTDLTPAGLDAAALNYAKTGQLPPLGMGDKTTRKRIINRAAEMMPGLDIASAKADYDANRQSLTALQKQRDAVGAFEETALKNVDLFLTAAAKIPDTGSPLLNTPIRAVNDRLFGSPEMATFNTQRRTVIPEFAKILNTANLSGQLSDSARHEIEEIVAGNATLKQMIATAKALKLDVTNRKTSYDDQIAGIKARIAKASAPAAATTPPASTRTDGDEGTINGTPVVWKTIGGQSGWVKK